MPKGSHSVSILQGKEKVCYLTGRTDNLHKHHIYPGPWRKASDKHGFWVWITGEWHNIAPYSIHRDGWRIKKQLQQECQQKFLETHTPEEWRAIINENYLDEVMD